LSGLCQDTADLRRSSGHRGCDWESQIIVSYGLTFNFKHILAGQEGLALSLHNTAEREGKILDEHLATVCRLRDYRICSIDTYLSDTDMVNSFSFWGGEYRLARLAGTGEDALKRIAKNIPGYP